jgi:hypothetical protein
MSLAELAKQGKFYAVLNIVRRFHGTLDISEFHERIEGKTVMGWTYTHKKPEIAEELLYHYSVLEIPAKV